MIDCQSDPVEEGLLLRESHRRISAAEQVSRERMLPEGGQMALNVPVPKAVLR